MNNFLHILKHASLVASILLLSSCGGGGDTTSGGCSQTKTIIYDCSALSGADKTFCQMQNNIGNSSCNTNYSGPSTTPALSDSKSISDFSFTSPAVTGTITEVSYWTHDIFVTVPYGTNVTSLVAKFTTTGKSVIVGSTPQISGSTANNFSSPVTYTVTAENGTMARYLVFVTIAQEKSVLTSFSFLNPAMSGAININAQTIDVAVPIGTDVTALVATFATSADVIVNVGSTTQISGATANDFTNPVTYTLTASAKDTATYTVSVTPQALWTWVSGTNTAEQIAIYGSKGTASATNTPGARYGASSWTDTGGNLWLFGGGSNNGTKLFAGVLNDLWKFDGTYWTWISGPNTFNQVGTYGTRGVTDATNIPGARNDAVSWIDGSGNLWLFGGWGYDSTGAKGILNDLWKFDGTYWTWVSGENTINQVGNYGTKGVAAAANVPGARYNAVSWMDGSGNLWLFGGYRSDSTSDYGSLNDLWKFDGTNWTWVSGANVKNQAGHYGSKGVAASTNVPGARNGAVSWIDGSGNLWLFGGNGVDSTGTSTSSLDLYHMGALGDLNDLWKFDGTSWTWVSGANTVNQAGNYGSKGVAAVANVPGARSQAVSWKDSNGNLWLFGGNGRGTAGTGNIFGDALNDLWKFDGTNWIWMSGATSAPQAGSYGMKGAAINIPSARAGANSWTDNSGDLWLFGGSGNDGSRSDLLRYHP